MYHYKYPPRTKAICVKVGLPSSSSILSLSPSLSSSPHNQSLPWQ